MKYVGWMYNDDTGASGSAVQDDDENTIAWFENADDAIAYVKMASDLAVAIKRAETAEAALSGLQHTVANYDVSLRRSDVDFAVEIIGMWHGNLAVLGFGVDSMLQTALTNALAQLTTWEQGQQFRV